MTSPERAGDMTDEITEGEALLLEAYGPLEMARIIVTQTAELRWIAAFADIRAKDDSKTFARVNRGALRNIATRATEAARTHTEGNP